MINKIIYLADKYGWMVAILPIIGIALSVLRVINY